MLSLVPQMSGLIEIPADGYTLRGTLQVRPSARQGRHAKDSCGFLPPMASTLRRKKLASRRMTSYCRRLCVPWN